MPDGPLKAIAELLPGILAGAWTGYITNDIALRMIFKEYRIWKFGFGGVIPKTRPKFIAGVADLVNDELIKPNVIRGQAQRKDFLDTAARCVTNAAGRIFAFIEGSGTLRGLTLSIKSGAGAGVEADACGLSAEAGGAAAEAGAEIAESNAGTAGYEGEPSDEISEWLAKTVIDALTRDGGGLTEFALNSSLRAIQNESGFLDRLIDDYKKNPEFIDANDEFLKSCGPLRIKSLLGERYYSDIKRRVLSAFDEFLPYAGTDFTRAARKLAGTASDLLLDERAVERFCFSIKNHTLFELFDIKDLGAWDSFFADRSRAELQTPSAHDGVAAFFDCTMRNSAFLEAKPSDFMRIDTGELEHALAGAYDMLTGMARGFMEKHRGELVGMLNTSIELGLNRLDEDRRGFAVYARKAVFSGAADRYGIFDRLGNFVVSSCADLQRRRIVGNEVSKVLNLRFHQLDLSDRMQKLRNDGGNGLTRIYASVKNAVLAAIGRIPRLAFGISPSSALKGPDAKRLAAKWPAAISAFLSDKICRPAADTANAGNPPVKYIRRAIADAVDELGEKELNDLRSSSPTRTSAGVRRAIFRGAAGIVKNTGKPIVFQLSKPIAKAFGKIKVPKVSAAIRKAAGASGPIDLSKGRSAEIYGYAMDKIEFVIRDKINESVRGKLENYNDEDLSSLARSFFGQLRHILILGAVMGAAIGLFTALLQNFFGVFLQNSHSLLVQLANTAQTVVFYAFIGWITNVAALELLFRPRRDISFIGISVKSVISRNKDKFANAVGGFLADISADPGANRGETPEAGQNRDRSTIRGESPDACLNCDRSITRAGARSHNLSHIYANAFAEQIKKAVPSLIQRYGVPADGGDSQLTSAAASMVTELRDYLNCNLASISCGLTESLIKLFTPRSQFESMPESLLEPRQEPRLEPQPEIGRHCRPPSGNGDHAASREQIADVFMALANSDISITKAIADGEWLRNSLRDWLIRADSIEIRGLLRYLLTSLYLSRISPNMDKPFFGNRYGVHNFIYRALIGKSTIRPPIGLLIEKLLECKSDALSVGLYNMIYDILQNNVPRICGYLRSVACETLARNGSEYAAGISRGIGERNGFLTSVVLRVTEGDELLEQAARNFISRQIPLFIERRADEIDALLSRVFWHALELLDAPRMPERLIGVDVPRLAELLDDIAGDEHAAFAAADMITGVAYDLFKGATVGEIAAMFGVGSPNELLRRSDTAIRLVADVIAEGMRIEADDLALAADGFIKETLGSADYNVAVRDIFGGVTRGDLAIISESLSDAYLGGGKIETLWKKTVHSRLVLERDVAERIFSTAINDLQYGAPSADITLTASHFLSCAAENFSVLWTEDFSEGFSKFVAQSLADELYENMDAVIRAADLHTVAERQINAMDTRKIESVFRAFAGRYIQRLKLYGLWGGLFGLHPILIAASAVFTGVKYASDRIKRNLK